MVKCEICSHRNICKLNRKGNCLPVLMDEIGHYDLHGNDFKWHEKKEEMIPVDLIIGGFGSLRRHEYDNNWKCVDPNRRWRHLLYSIKKRGYDNTRRFPVDLVEFEGKYYVAGDGYHRVAIAQLLGIDKIKATVTRLECIKPRSTP